MTTNVYLVRHAHSVYTPDELTRPLSEKGLRDAESILTTLKSEKIDDFISSPYRRAIQTIEPLAKYYQTEIKLNKAFQERTLAQGKVKDFNAAITKVWQEPDFAFDGGESNLNAQARGIKGFMSILQTYEDRNIVIGTHGNIMVLIMNYFNAEYGFEFWRKLQMPDIYKMSFSGKELMGIEQVLLKQS
ncbi:histidine phosphatase family protein [Viridibacillus sp. YIM B01967]|uniref:Histidine phosphatase family protein n=1 Tax=Viridibacillus soli TaxID=2798301 RepID=A0ABS1H5K2_9BACL|nr:histidine phosphatase family protein [Viridibacillus soli]MBK3494692.1 histidine phosphatase family protein [Viridibacillus soli]